MTKYTTSVLIILALIIVLITPVCTMSVDPTRMDEMLFEQRNDVHSLAANMYNTLRNPDNQEMADRLINKSLESRYTEEVVFGYKKESQWNINSKKDEYINTINDIRRIISVDDFRSCRISINADISSNNNAYYSGNRRISRQERDELYHSVSGEVAKDTGFIDSFLPLTRDVVSDESINRMRELESETDDAIKNHPDYPITVPTIVYTVNIIPNETHYISFKLKEMKGITSYSSPIILSSFEDNLVEYYGD
jgi:hypothetical protein